MASVLIIDDDLMFCDLLGGAMRNVGHHAACVHTLKEGLGEVDKGCFDLVFVLAEED